MCLEAFREGRTDCAWTLKYMPDRLMTPAVCLESVKLAGWTLQFVPEALKTRDFCLAAVRSQGWALKHVPAALKTAEMCLEAVRRSPGAARLLPDVPALRAGAAAGSPRRSRLAGLPCRPRRRPNY